MLCMRCVLCMRRVRIPGGLPQSLKEDGAYVINDPKGLPTPAENIHRNPAALLFYGFSCHSCLPSGETLALPCSRRNTC